MCCFFFTSLFSGSLSRGPVFDAGRFIENFVRCVQTEVGFTVNEPGGPKKRLPHLFSEIAFWTLGRRLHFDKRCDSWCGFSTSYIIYQGSVYFGKILFISILTIQSCVGNLENCLSLKLQATRGYQLASSRPKAVNYSSLIFCR